MDPIADMINRLKTARLAGKDVVVVPLSNIKAAIAEKLRERGIVSEVAKRGKKAHRTLELTLARSDSGKYRFNDVRRVSKPGCRVYAGATDIQSVRGGTGTLYVSTPKGVLSGEEAKREKVGGELLFEIW